jgi:ubiquinone biosynthesis protein
VVRFGFAHLLHMFGLDRFRPAPRTGKIDAATRGLEPPVRVRLLLEELGPAGVKIGQALASRADLLPPEYIAELRKLQDEVPPFPFEAARAVIEQELGCPPEEYFAEIDPVPVAAASLSQVHRARRHDGREVAVKVQRPEVRQQIEQDLQLLSLAAREAQRRSEWCRDNDVISWAAEFSHILRAELDFTREGQNTDRLRESLVDTPHVVVPRVHWDLTAHRLLVLDFVAGVTPKDAAGLDALGVDRPRLAQRFAAVMFKQVTQEGFFHADPHAGNLKVLADGRIALLDAGHVDYAGRDLRDHILALLQALVEGDSRGVVNVLTAVGVISARTDLASVRLDVDKMVAQFAPTRTGGFAFAEALDSLFGLLVKHGVRVPATFASLLRALMITQGVCLMLDPQFDAWVASSEAVQSMLRRRLRPHELFAVLQGSVREWGYYAKTLPRQLSDLILRTQAGGTRVRLEIEHIDRSLHRLDIMVNRLSFAVVVAAIIIGSATILASARASAAIGNPLALGFAAIGGLMGLWLLYSIIRSGRL